MLQRMPAEIKAVDTISTPLAGSARMKYLSSCGAALSPCSQGMRSGSSSQSMSMKVGKTGRKNSAATSKPPAMKNAPSPNCCGQCKAGLGRRLAGSKAP
jgi:hypothetical protein